MDEPLVSVIIPVYNVEKYLNDCVDSVINQTYQRLEILLIDDGSTDGSSAICDKYKRNDNRVKVFHIPNSGQSFARNLGLAHASGIYIYFLDSDDSIYLNTIEVCVFKIQETESDFVFFDACTVIEDDNELLFPKVKKYERKMDYGTLTSLEMFLKLVERDDYKCSCPLLFIKSEIFKKNNLFFIDNILHEDELFTFLLFLRSNKVTHLMQNLYLRRMRIGSTTQSKIDGRYFLGVSYVFLYMKEFYCIEKSIFSKLLSRFSKRMIIYYNQLSKMEKSIYKPMFNENLRYIRDNNYFGNKRLWLITNCFYIWRIKMLLSLSISKNS